MTPEQYCQARAAQAGSSFYYAFRFLPAPRRAAIIAFYAFCREADDVVDQVSDPGVALSKLGFWRDEVKALYQGRASHPVCQALQAHIAAYAIPESALTAVLDGMEQDLRQFRYRDEAELERYCYLVAGVVGEVSARIFGISPEQEEATLAYARTLGSALQRINILRDVGEDARRGRVYLPQTLLEQHGLRVQDILQLQDSDGLRRALQDFYGQAIARYDEALRLLPLSERKAQRAGLAMAAIYRALAEEIQRDGFRVLKHRVALTPIRKLWIAWKTVRSA